MWTNPRCLCKLHGTNSRVFQRNTRLQPVYRLALVAVRVWQIDQQSLIGIGKLARLVHLCTQLLVHSPPDDTGHLKKVMPTSKNNGGSAGVRSTYFACNFDRENWSCPNWRPSIRTCIDTSRPRECPHILHWHHIDGLPASIRFRLKLDDL